MSLDLLRRDPVTAESDELRLVDGLLLRHHRKLLAPEEHELLRRLQREQEMTDEQLAARQARVVKRKADDTAARAAAVPKLTGKPVTVGESELIHLTPQAFGAILNGDRPVPPPGTRYDYAQGDDADYFAVMVSTLRDVVERRRSTGTIACVRFSRDQFGAVPGLRTFIADERFVGGLLDIDQTSFIPLPGQSPKQLADAADALRKAAAEVNNLASGWQLRRR